MTIGSGAFTYSATGISGAISGLQLTNNVVQITSGPATLFRVRGYNSNTAQVWLQLFDAYPAQVTLGTTAPKDSIPLLPMDGFDDTSCQMIGADFFNAISVAATSTITGSATPGTSIPATFFYR